MTMKEKVKVYSHMVASFCRAMYLRMWAKYHVALRKVKRGSKA